MKDWILEILDVHLGKVFLALALLWAGLTLVANRPEKLPATLTDVPPREVYVGLDHKAMSKASSETYYVAGPAENYVASGRFVFVPEVITKVFVPVELDTPPLSVRRSPQLLPDPGPSLEGADKLPRFGEEFPAMAPADLPANARVGGTSGGGGGFNAGTGGSTTPVNSAGSPINK